MDEGLVTIPLRTRLNYEDKVILAPMVRIGTLPMRLLALDYGADIVYTEELIDWKLLRSFRRENDVLGTIDYIDKTDGTVVFRTCQRERDKVVLQLGTRCALRALEVAKMIEADVAGIDLNMGCPKPFSLLGQMGAALLREPETATNILKTLVDNLNIPVTCKIRVLEDCNDTLELCDRLAATGIAAIAVHGRTVNERPRHPNRNEFLKRIADRLSIPVIANGGSRDVQNHSDISRFKEATGCSSVMLARAAEWNCSIFSGQGLVPVEDLIKAYLKYAVDCDNPPSNTKFCVQNVLREQQESPLGRRFLDSQTLEQICNVWDLGEYCRARRKEFDAKGLIGRYQVAPMRLIEETNGDPMCKKRKTYERDDVVLQRFAFVRKSYRTDLELPKTVLHTWMLQQKMKIPRYETINEDRLFRSIVTVDGKQFSSSFWEKSKKWAEQGAALVSLFALGIIDEKTVAASGNAIS